MKKCIKCKKTFPKTNEYFYYLNKGRGWLSSWCKKCHKLHRQQLSPARKKHWKKYKLSSAQKEHRKKYLREYYFKHRTKLIEKASEYVKTHRKEKRENALKYYKSEKGKVTSMEAKSQRRVRLRGNHVQLTKAEHRYVRELYRIARKMRSMGNNVEVDHIIPIAKGGLHIPMNLQILSMRENRRKGCSLFWTSILTMI